MLLLWISGDVCVGVTSHTPRIYFPKVFPCFLVIISHLSSLLFLGENIPLGEYSLQLTLQFD
jgi:hypothetical protein